MSKPKEIVNRSHRRFYVWGLSAYSIRNRSTATVYSVLDELDMHREVAVYGPSPGAEEKAKKLCEELNRDDGERL